MHLGMYCMYMCEHKNMNIILYFNFGEPSGAINYNFDEPGLYHKSGTSFSYIASGYTRRVCTFCPIATSGQEGMYIVQYTYIFSWLVHQVMNTML